MPDVPFQRTVCACDKCVNNCKTQPGFLIPGDAERITAFTGLPAKDLFADSQGGQVMDVRTRIVSTIRTIVPQSDKTGRCIFLTEDDQCSIHPVAPFGCAYFDCATGQKEAHHMSRWGMLALEADKEYSRLRVTLPFAKSHKAKPFHHNLKKLIEQCRR